MLEYFSIADIESLPPGTGRTVQVRGREFAVYNCDGQFFAIDDLCPHKGAQLGAGTLDNDTVFCPLHGWGFDVKTGRCISNPEKGVRTYPVRVRNGEVQIGLSNDSVLL
jgi:nitrite reductase (NADH) small subunit